MGLFGKSKKDAERESRLVEKMFQAQFLDSLAATTNKQEPRKIVYQCKYCGYKSVRYATEGVPFPGVNCPRHPRGPQKGPHSWMRTYL